MDKVKFGIFIAFCALVALALIGAVILMIYGIEVSAYFTQVGVLLGLVTVAAGTFWNLGKLNTIESNTNGRLTSRDNEIKRLTNILVGMGVDPNAVQTGAVNANEIAAAAEMAASYQAPGGRHVAP